MRWQQLDILPPIDTLVLIWLEDGPALARRVDGSKDSGWYWQLEGEFDASPDEVIRWANITPPRL